jgi:hypothetical protein
VNPEKFRRDMKYLITTDDEFVAATEREYSSTDLWLGGDVRKVMFFGLTKKDVFLGTSRRDNPYFPIKNLSEVKLVRITDPTLKKPLPIRLELYDFQGFGELPFVSLAVAKKFTESFFAQVHGGVFESPVTVETITWDEYVRTRSPKAEMLEPDSVEVANVGRATVNIVEDLKALDDLFMAGVLSDSEFAAAKAKLLN